MSNTQTNVVQLKRPPAAPTTAIPEFDGLSFVSRRKPRGSGFNYWDVAKATQQGLTGWPLGERLAREYADFLVNSNYAYGSFSLIAIVSDMPPRKEWTGVEQGFLREVDRLFSVGAYAYSKTKRGGMPDTLANGDR